MFTENREGDSGYAQRGSPSTPAKTPDLRPQLIGWALGNVGTSGRYVYISENEQLSISHLRPLYLYRVEPQWKRLCPRMSERYSVARPPVRIAQVDIHWVPTCFLFAADGCRGSLLIRVIAMCLVDISLALSYSRIRNVSNHFSALT
jgi:hypothetical protein